jgi:NADPH:quinone reductase-like Zn-dependent oxidoreductase
MFDFPQSVRLMKGNHTVAYVGLPQDTMQFNPTRIVPLIETLFDYTADGRLTVETGHAFALEQAAAAHTAVESRARHGKVYFEP